MYYIWEKYADATTDLSDYFRCGISSDYEEIFDKAEDCFMFGKKIDFELPNPFKYHAVNMANKVDFPSTVGGMSYFLLSQKIADILKKLKTPNIEYYPSIIIRPNNEIIENYYTLNIMNVIDCINLKNSKYVKSEYLGYQFKKLVLNLDKIPKDIKLFHLYECETMIVAHEDIVKACKDAGVTGIDFVPVEKYRDLGI